MLEAFAAGFWGVLGALGALIAFTLGLGGWLEVREAIKRRARKRRARARIRS